MSELEGRNDNVLQVLQNTKVSFARH